MKRTSHQAADCPIARSLDAIGDWWSLLIVRDALLGLSRFGEFQKSLGMAKNILAARLRSLTALGILETVPVADGSQHREYRLTPKGRDLYWVLVALRQWGDTYQFPGGASPTVLVDRVDGLPVQALELHAADGRRLGPADTRVVRTA
ncbi:winged helix-turn-helix transcriptional regulator [Ferrovibrio xuzhouensis]|uniref:Winged helix-turn-helix transcriptional regulator n=1 Tax=Ferrovibrio xuzhouensis TaxID=1576914 RepID=A0ABV7VKL6_9PROT